ncbi:leucine-rich repeat-containing protein 69-like isoform X1 [Anneissia japonica]|uniref:leucine-rich repeat-containing protein 69-like isoform X1 n=1 Tax=Anneissia japonica TaxID=1529436 RepID=UPI00142556D1|nr:leucine-rich repeat-containing protein 69-like isoform X1 [Anneissia japonica]
MADALLLRALKGQPKSLNLSSKNLLKVPKLIGKLQGLNNLQLKNNKIHDLPVEFSALTKLVALNIGNNNLEEIPELLGQLHSLETLHLFGNKIQKLPNKVLGGLRNLTFLNLNNNDLRTVTPTINKLVNLQYLSLDGNNLTSLPSELCAISSLTELHAANNQLTALPLEIGFLVNLTKLYLQKNKIRELPEGIGKLYNLQVIDVAANDLRIFPTELHKLPLQELYCEENPLIDRLPIQSVQEEEVLTLKEICARFIMAELKTSLKHGSRCYSSVSQSIRSALNTPNWNTLGDSPVDDRWSYLRIAIRHYPSVKEMLGQASKCAFCNRSFLNTWLECVTFVDAKKDLKTINSPGRIPIRALLCSYKCFNSPGHRYYGVAFP